MEGELNLPIDLSKQSHPTIEEFSSQPFQERQIQSSFIWVNPLTHTISGLPDMSLQPFASQQICDFNSLPAYVPEEALLSGGFSGPLYDLHPDQLGENMVSNNWMSQNYMNLVDQTTNANNELSLRLSAYSKPPSVNEGSSIHNQCSDTSGKQSMSSVFDSKSSEFSQILSQPKYLGVIQEILSQFTSFSLENMDHQLNTSHLDHCAEQGDSFKDSDESSNLGGVFVEAPPRRRETEAKKSQLLSLLQMLDDCYNQCLDEIHTVISAFHAATELDPHTHASFALRTISILYKSLKERISNQILKMSAYDDVGDGIDASVASGSCSRDQIERSFEKSFIQKQWALQQLKRKDQQLWRPQRGLPERSVSVLRAWMFQNFLHPYPKDAEKHLLAIKSGLTRSQVSNWFINARVRLWKPLIEEMYAELNRSRAGNGHNQGNEGSNTYNCLSIRNSRYNNTS